MATERYIRKAPYDDHPERVTVDPTTKKKKYRCRWCFKELTGRRTGWCSQECVDEFLLRKSGTALRSAVYDRDKGVCARCGIDTRQIKRLMNLLQHGRRARSKRYVSWSETERGKWFTNRERRTTKEWIRLNRIERRRGKRSAKKLNRLRPKLEALRAWMKRRGWTPTEISGAKTLWQADHIQAVVEGGGGCGIENIRTVCVPCHHEISAELAARRAQERRRKKTKQQELKLEGGE